MNDFLYKDDLLELGKSVTENEIEIDWFGKSIEREPGKVLNPIFSNLIMEGRDTGKRILMSFVDLKYMNSSTIMVISKFLEKGKENNSKITIRYNSDRRWQKLSFNALQIFQTNDGRIVFDGLSET